MKHQVPLLYQIFLGFIVIVKVLYIGLAIYSLYISKKEPDNKKKIEEILYLKERVEVLFKGLMAILLIYLFNPIFNKTDNMILNYETRLFLFIFGIIIFLTADWETIFKNIPKSYKLIQNIIGNFHILENK